MPAKMPAWNLEMVLPYRKSGSENTDSISHCYIDFLDYGDGPCDDKATVTANGKTYNIILL